MEALAALSLAGTIVQFVDFSTRILSSGKEIYNSSTGSLTANEEVHLVTADLLVIVKKFQDVGGAGVAFERVCSEAIRIAEELIEKLEGLKVDWKNKMWRSFRQAMQTALSAKDVSALQDRLSLLSRALETHILLALREDVNLVMLRFSQHFDSLDQQTQRIITALLETQSKSLLKDSLEPELQDQTIALTQLLNRIETSNLEEHHKTRALVLEKAANKGADITEQLLKVTLKSEVLGVPPEEEKQLRIRVQTSILESLNFPTMNNRYKEIQEAYKKTLEWAFHDKLAIEAGNLPWDCFTDWLDEGSGVYWLNGKAGSGKSTLMRYLCDDLRTRMRLKTWAKDYPLQIISFFFWNSGTPEQRSQMGLLQALLFEILHEEPELIPIVLPTGWARVYSRHVQGKPDFAPTVWSLSTLTAAFKNLFKQTAVPFKLCLFVDGLDEYDGDHEEMASLFREVTSSPNVKACVSSRSWVVFQDSFKTCPSLRLQDLTRGDIVFYTSSKLNNSDLFQLLEEKEPRRAPELVLEIAKRANGVFLWVKIVVASLLSGLRSRDEIEDLQRRLDVLPRELKPLYQHMVGLIDPLHQVRASEIFQIFRTSRDHPRHLGWRKDGVNSEPLTIYGLFLATSTGLTLAAVRSYDDQRVEVLSADMEIKLSARCAGLLETSGGHRDYPEKARKEIQYLHRTARDFIEGPEKWREVLELTAGTNFHGDTALLRSCVLQLNTAFGERIHFLEQQNIAFKALLHAYFADVETHVSNADLLDQLDDLMTSRAQNSHVRSHHWSYSLLRNQTYDLGLEHISSFETLAIRFGLLEYVKELAEKSQWGRKSLKKTLGHSKLGNRQLPLLSYAVAPVTGGGHIFPCSPGLVALLLSHGSDPNENGADSSGTGPSCTPWERALACLTKETYDDQDEHELRKHFQVLELLVRAGASPTATVQQPDGMTVSALKLIASKFDRIYPQDMSRLEETLRKGGADFSPYRVVEVIPRTKNFNTFIRGLLGRKG